MIELYSGTPGSGKSYHATRDIYEALHWYKRCRPVIANYDLPGEDSEDYHYVPNHELTAEFLMDFADKWWSEHPDLFREDGILLVVDEAQLLFNSRTWNAPDRMAFLEFLSQHRHFGYRIILVAQSAGMIDKQFRALIEYEVNHRKLSNFGWMGRFLSIFFAGRLHAAVRRYFGLSEKVAVQWFVVRKKITRLYNSYNRFQRTNDVQAPGIADPSTV